MIYVMKSGFVIKIMIWAAVMFAVCASASRAAVKKAMIPDSGIHDLIEHNYAAACDVKGQKGLKCGRGGVGADTSRYTTGALATLTREAKLKFPARELVLTWNADVPAGAWLEIRFRVRGPGNGWSGWYEMGSWWRSEQGKRFTKDPVYGKLHVDELKADADFDRVQYSISFNTVTPGVSPVLRRVWLSVSRPAAKDETIEVTAPAGARQVKLNVPWMSQLLVEHVGDEELVERGVCAATSVTMVMNSEGAHTTISETARRAYDPVADIYGNWAFLVAAAGDKGFNARVQRFRDWHGVRRLVESGAPVIISIAYEKGTMSAEPDRRSDGHLIVVIGFTKDGDVIVNDPGTRFEDRGRGYVYPWQELAIAFFGHGGVGIVISK